MTLFAMLIAMTLIAMIKVNRSDWLKISFQGILWLHLYGIVRF